MLGNGEHHWRTWELILEKPGYILIHDARIPDIPLFEFENSVWRELDYYAKAEKFLGRLPTHTKGIFTHSRHAAETVRKQLNSRQLNAIPIHVLKTGHPAETILERRVYPKRNPVIGTFGFQSPNKNPRLTYSVIAQLAALTNGRGVVCGNIDEYHQRMAKRIWLDSGNKLSDLEIYSWVNEEEYKQIMARVDIGVQLRTSSAGESSGPFTQLTSRGVPTVVSDIGTFSEFPNLSGVLKLPLVTSKVDLTDLLGPFVELLSSEQEYISSSLELMNYYRDKTYFHCASEIYNEIFK
jgi:glycosyltransferase involved in cell wall biosynthesis